MGDMTMSDDEAVIDEVQPGRMPPGTGDVECPYVWLSKLPTKNESSRQSADFWKDIIDDHFEGQSEPQRERAVTDTFTITSITRGAVADDDEMDGCSSMKSEYWCGAGDSDDDGGNSWNLNKLTKKR